jgi:hypothetical protein
MTGYEFALFTHLLGVVTLSPRSHSSRPPGPVYGAQRMSNTFGSGST